MNVRAMVPVLMQSAEAAGWSVGTPFFIKHCRVGVLNDIGQVLTPDVVILLIGERPGLGRALPMAVPIRLQAPPASCSWRRR
jgi:ethanolamine ammonia-lyase small subunit